MTWVLWSLLIGRVPALTLRFHASRFHALQAVLCLLNVSFHQLHCEMLLPALSHLGPLTGAPHHFVSHEVGSPLCCPARCEACRLS